MGVVLSYLTKPSILRGRLFVGSSRGSSGPTRLPGVDLFGIRTLRGTTDLCSFHKHREYI